MTHPTPHPLRVFAMKAVTFFYRRAIFLVRSLDTSFEVDIEPPARSSILRAEDLPAYAALRPDQSVDVAAKRLARGDECFVVWYGDEITHAGWVTTRRVYIPYLQSDMLVMPGDVYSYDNFTAPSFRGKGLAVAKSSYLQQHFRALGYRRCTAIVAAENEAGGAFVRAARYHPIGLYTCIRIGFSRVCWRRAWGPDPLPELAAPRSA